MKPAKQRESKTNKVLFRNSFLLSTKKFPSLHIRLLHTELKISASSSFFICRLEHTHLIQMGVTAVAAKNIDFLPSWSTTESEKFTDLSDLIFSVISSMPQESCCYKLPPKNKSQNKEFKMYV